MAYIAPQGRVEFFGDLGLDPGYENTLYFASMTARNDYFSALTQITQACTAQSYTRQERGVFRVQKTMADLIGASYCRFRNTGFENKWFYAFIDHIEYVNNETTAVYFQLDVMMTWMGAFELGQCYIERQHATSDNIGENVVDEGLNTGSYVCEGTQLGPVWDYKIALYQTYDPDDAQHPLTNPLSQGTYVPMLRTFYDMDDSGVEDLQDYLDDLTTDNRSEQILTLKLCPSTYAITDTPGEGEEDPPDPIEAPPYTISNIVKPYTNIGGNSSEISTITPYVPHNKKLFVYPYKYLEVDNCEGDTIAYNYECFNTLPGGGIATGYSDTANFMIMGTAVTPEISILAIPVEYNGKPFAYENSIKMQSFPSLCWNVDAYKAYLAQRDSTIFGNVVVGAASGAVKGAVSGGPAGAAVGAVKGAISGSGSLLSDVTNDLLRAAGIDLPTRMPSQTRGGTDSNILVQAKMKNFLFRKMCITKEYAQMIDNYFDMFGYAQRKVATPNMNARTHYTYVKTKGCIVHGNLPADDARKIEEIFDKGVRFWKNHTRIGNYAGNQLT